MPEPLFLRPASQLGIGAWLSMTDDDNWSPLRSIHAFCHRLPPIYVVFFIPGVSRHAPLTGSLSPYLFEILCLTIFAAATGEV